MEKIFTQSKISKINLDTMFFEIILSTKGNSFRVRSASLAQIPNIKIDRPEATSTISYENAIQKLIPKIENSLEGTDKCLGKIFQSDSGKLMYSIENIIYKNNKNNSSQEDSLNMFTSIFVEVLKNLAPSLNINNNNVQQVSDVIVNNVNDITKNSQLLTNTSNHKKFSDICVEWLQHLLERTKKNYDDEDYLTPGTLEGYNRVLRDHVFPYLEEHSEYDNILFFVESNVDEILDRTNSKDTKRLLLISLRLIFEFAKENCFVSYAMKRIREENGSLNIAALSSEIGYSQKYLDRIFRAETGLTMKKYATIIRIQAAIRYLQEDRWDEVYEILGYYDQSHFIKDFKRYTCMTPRQFCRVNQKMIV